MENFQIPNPVETLSREDKKLVEGNLEKIVVAICFISLLVVPLVFVPFLTDFLEFPKQIIVFYLGLFGVLLWSVRNFIKGRFSWTRTSFDLPFIILALVAVVSAFLSPNFYTSLSSDTLIIVGGAALFFLFANALTTEGNVSKVAKFLGISGALIGVLMAIQLVYALVAPALKLNLNFFLLNPGFNLAGSPLAAGLFIVALLPFLLGLLKTPDQKAKGIILPLVVLMVIGVLCSLVMLYQNRPILLDHMTGWKVATGVMGENPQSALLGVGAGNIIDAFTAYKPIDFNAATFWNLRFSTSSNFYLSILTSLGILGFAAIIFFVVNFVRIAKSRFNLDATQPLEKGLLSSIGIILVLGLLLPTPTLSLFLLFVLSGTLMAFYKAKGVSLYSKQEESGKKFIPAVVSVLLAVVLVATLIWPGYLRNFVVGDYFFAKSLEAASQNRGKDTYDLQIQALSFNPWNSNYRIAYSQTNLALANSLAGQANLTDEQKQTVVTLVQQAIREGRLGVLLAPRRAGAYENLSLIYRNLINFAQGADQWSVQSQNSAVQLDPTNPRLRLDLGGIFFAAGQYQDAAQIFNQAVNLKPDFANAHYNLAQSLVGLKQYQLALQELQTTSTLVCATQSKADCDRVNAEIKALTTQAEKEAAGAEATPSGEPVVAPKEQEPLATPSANSNLPQARPTPVPKVASGSGELEQ